MSEATTAYKLSTPAGRSGVISPLTTVAHQLMRDTGVTSAEADEFSELESVDMAAARTAASISPIRPVLAGK